MNNYIGFRGIVGWAEILTARCSPSVFFSETFNTNHNWPQNWHVLVPNYLIETAPSTQLYINAPTGMLGWHIFQMPPPTNHKQRPELLCQWHKGWYMWTRWSGEWSEMAPLSHSFIRPMTAVHVYNNLNASGSGARAYIHTIKHAGMHLQHTQLSTETSLHPKYPK